MSLSIALFERQPQSIAVCYLFLLSPSQNTPSCYFASSALILKAFKGKTAEGEKATIISIANTFYKHKLLYPCRNAEYFSKAFVPRLSMIKVKYVVQIPLIKGGRGLSSVTSLTASEVFFFLFFISSTQ